MKASTKVLTIAIIAMFCATGFVGIAAEQNDAADVTYHFYFELRGDTGSIDDKGWYNASASSASLANFVDLVNKGAEKVVGLKDVCGDSGWFNYEGRGSVATFVPEGQFWIASAGTSDYGSKTEFAIIFGGYATDEIAAKNPSIWASTGWGGEWGNIAVISEKTNGWESSDNTMLYIIIAVVAIVVIIALVFFFMKKKNASA